METQGKKTQCQEAKRARKIDSDMTKMLELSDRIFTIT